MLFFGNAQAANGIDDDEVLIADEERTVLVADLRAALWAMNPSQRYEVQRNPENIERILDSLYINSVLSEEARSSGLAETPEVRQRIVQARETELSRLYAREAPDNVPSWEELEQDRSITLHSDRIEAWREQAD